jgi:hypothetical protein
MEYREANTQTSNIRCGGSFVISAICRDGIILASESRANIFHRTDPSQTPLAYYDTCQKIFPIGEAAIAETGQGLIGNAFFSAIVGDFSQRIIQHPSSNNLLSLFIDHCKKTMQPDVFAEIRKQKLFAAGYNGSIPFVCYFNEQQPDGPFGCINAGLIESYKTSLSERKDELKNLTVTKVAQLSQKAIQSYAGEGERWKSIGGPIDVLCITPSGSCWLKKNTPDQKYTSVKEFVIAYQQGNIPLTLIPPATQEQLEDLFSTVS